MPKLLDEASRHRKGFHPGSVPVTLGDGQIWYLANPAVAGGVEFDDLILEADRLKALALLMKYHGLDVPRGLTFELIDGKPRIVVREFDERLLSAPVANKKELEALVQSVVEDDGKEADAELLGKLDRLRASLEREKEREGKKTPLA
jgi:hypothetical protein